jgi:hypothetical protein
MREIRPSGSVRGVRRKPYPYRDNPQPDAEGSAGLGMLKPTHHSAFRRPILRIPRGQFVLAVNRSNPSLKWRINTPAIGGRSAASVNPVCEFRPLEDSAELTPGSAWHPAVYAGSA